MEVFPAGDARVVGGGFTEALVSMTGLGMGARTLLAGEPFRPVLSRAAMVAAVALIGGGILWQLCFGIGESMAAREALEITGWNWDESIGVDDPATLLPFPRLGITIEFWPMFTGMALAAVAAAFRYGEKPQRDTAGLV